MQKVLFCHKYFRFVKIQKESFSILNLSKFSAKPSVFLNLMNSLRLSLFKTGSRSSQFRVIRNMCAHSNHLISVEFLLSGRVQGVFMRACTSEKAKALGLRGWVMNTPEGRVKGVIQGDETAVDEMMVNFSFIQLPTAQTSTQIYQSII